MLGGKGTTQVLIDLEFIRKENGIEMDTDEFAIDGADRIISTYFCLFGVDVAKAKYYDIRCTLIPSQLQPVFLLEMFI